MPQAPEKIQPQGLADYLEVMSRAVFQTGISWRIVDAKWPGIKQAFFNFEPLAVASITVEQMEALVQDKRVIRNRRKLEAIVGNAQRMIELEEQHNGFQRYLRSHGGFEPCVTGLRQQFRFLGDLGAYYFLYVVGEDVPSYEDWCASRGRRPMHG